jgi:hypothetical protein
MLLQFNKHELSEAERAIKEPSWNSRPAKEIKRSLPAAKTRSSSTVTEDELNDSKHGYLDISNHSTPNT